MIDCPPNIEIHAPLPAQNGRGQNAVPYQNAQSRTVQSVNALTNDFSDIIGGGFGLLTLSPKEYGLRVVFNKNSWKSKKYR